MYFYLIWLYTHVGSTGPVGLGPLSGGGGGPISPASEGALE